MKNNVHLNEENYQKTEKKISFAAILILIIGLCIGGYLVYNGIAKPNSSKVESLQETLEEKKKELEDKGIKESSNYNDGEAYDLYILNNALDPSFGYCSFNEYKNNSITKEYCSAKNSVDDFASSGSIMIGAFICIASCMISFAVFMFAKGRKVAAFTTQQMMPIAKEGIDEIAPTVGNSFGEIAKGIKEGMKDEEK